MAIVELKITGFTLQMVIFDLVDQVAKAAVSLQETGSYRDSRLDGDQDSRPGLFAKHARFEVLSDGFPSSAIPALLREFNYTVSLSIEDAVKNQSLAVTYNEYRKRFETSEEAT